MQEGCVLRGFQKKEKIIGREFTRLLETGNIIKFTLDHNFSKYNFVEELLLDIHQAFHPL
jgi:hypothetical protein